MEKPGVWEVDGCTYLDSLTLSMALWLPMHLMATKVSGLDCLSVTSQHCKPLVSLISSLSLAAELALSPRNLLNLKINL